jgi:hypothetical protein
MPREALHQGQPHTSTRSAKDRDQLPREALWFKLAQAPTPDGPLRGPKEVSDDEHPRLAHG